MLKLLVVGAKDKTSKPLAYGLFDRRDLLLSLGEGPGAGEYAAR